MLRFNYDTEFVNAHGKFFDNLVINYNELIQRSHYGSHFIHTHTEFIINLHAIIACTHILYPKIEPVKKITPST
jgi:hypothetical protein